MNYVSIGSSLYYLASQSSILVSYSLLYPALGSLDSLGESIPPCHEPGCRILTPDSRCRLVELMRRYLNPSGSPDLTTSPFELPHITLGTYCNHEGQSAAE